MSQLSYPALTSDHLQNARLFPGRADMLLGLEPEKGRVIGELGVGLGSFSDFFLRQMSPSIFVGFDHFKLHMLKEFWGKTSYEHFGMLTHRELYEQQFKEFESVLIVEEGESSEKLSSYPDRFFDVLYIDADHSYEGAVKDATVAVRKIKPHGLLVFNDYIVMDHFTKLYYGVVPAVNELVANSDWKVVGLALEPHMFCDIALRRG
jgi:hypothetical protein